MAAVNTIDPRIQLLSHSSRTLLHTCPRKFQLYRMNTEAISLEAEKETEQGVTFAFGTTVGVGIQSVLEGKSEEQVTLDCFLSWDVDLLDENSWQKKSFWSAMFAVQKFQAVIDTGGYEDYELVYFLDYSTGEQKPAIELSFQIIMPDGFRYRGFVDAVLRHKETGEILVLECKTSAWPANSGNYKNSGQALGYSVVLDILFPELSSYTVLYLVYETKKYEYVELPFQKSLLQRALWLQELVIDAQIIELYDSYDTYPMHGESCRDFNRDCEYLGLCTLQTKNLVKPLSEKILEKIDEDLKRYEFTISFKDLVEAQIAKGETV